MKQTWIGVIRGGHFWGRAVHCARGWGESVGMLLLALAATASLPARANIAVGSSGQAAYSMPIGVPPGIAGMAPNLSLSYTDGGINGPLGVGWSLQGISTITRCGSTRPIDGVARAVDFTGDDKLCLDGQRLIQTRDTGEVFPAPVYDLTGKFASFPQVGDASGVVAPTPYREFRTEKDTFARIRAYGQAGSAPGGAPAFFRVWTKSGQLYEYGLNPATGDANALILGRRVGTAPLDPTPVMVWAVRRISDTLANYIDFRYTQGDVTWGSGAAAADITGREWNLAEIQYTGNAGTAPSTPRNKIVFSYADRALDAAPGLDPAEAYQFNVKNVSVQRLLEIRTYINTPNVAQSGPDPTTAVGVRAYKLSYERGPTSGRSRLNQITECAGAGFTRCLPPAVFTYTAGSGPNFITNAAFGAGPLGTLKMLEPATGNYGVLTGDFDGDGRTDILRWSNIPAENELSLSTGGGNFYKPPAFNLTTVSLFKTDGCYYSIVADFNGDGLSDILRVAKTGCVPSDNLLLLSNGNGSFSTTTLPPLIDLQQTKASYSSYGGASCIALYGTPPPAPEGRVSPPIDNYGPAGSAVVNPPSETPTIAGVGNCTAYNRTRGKRFYIIDVNGDGILDLVITTAAPYMWNSGWGPLPSEEDLCTGGGYPPYYGTCSRVFIGSATGQYTEKVDTNITYSSLYSDPPGTANRYNNNPYWRLPDQADISGDGLQDILAARTGRWRSTGDGNFTASPVQDGSQLCSLPIDFNGDGRSDCLLPGATPTAQSLALSYGAASSAALPQFNLTNAGDNLYALDANQRQTVGVVIEDFDGDGRQDILRWGSASSDNGIYLSNGDASFRTRTPAGLNAITKPLQSVDGSTSFVLGDFLGTGAVQILHMKDNPAALGNQNQLYVRDGSSVPMDVLATVLSPSGLLSTVGPRVPLANSGGRYYSERIIPRPAVTTSIVDLQPPMYVITSLTQDTGVGLITTEYMYKGLKAERGGRGLLGFREMRQQSPLSDGSPMTVVTQYLQTHPYIGVAAVSETLLDSINSVGPPSSNPGPLSRTTYSYCDKTSIAIPSDISISALTSPATAPVPCSTDKRVQRPYLYQSVEQGRDLNNAVITLPTVTTTNTYNNAGDPLAIAVNTTGSALGLVQTFTKTVSNVYNTDITSGDNWILGRLARATVQNTAPNSLPSIATAAGNSPNATARTGSGPRPASASLPPGVLNAILLLLLDD